MRRRGKSPWLEAERKRIREEAPQGVLSRIADGESAFLAWRTENATTPGRLARASGIPIDRIDRFERGLALPHPDELEGLAKALRVVPELLMRPRAEPDGEEPGWPRLQPRAM